MFSVSFACKLGISFGKLIYLVVHPNVVMSGKCISIIKLCVRDSSVKKKFETIQVIIPGHETICIFLDKVLKSFPLNLSQGKI